MALNDDTFSTHPDLVELRSAGVALPPPPPRRRTTKVAVGLAVVFSVIAGLGAWWFTSSTVPNGDYDEAMVELDAVNAQLAEVRTASEAEVAELNGQVEALSATAADLTAANAELESTAARVEDLTTLSEALQVRLDAAADVSEALAHLELAMDPDVYADLADVGVDFTLLDGLLSALGYDQTVASYVEEGRGWIHANSAIILVNDDELLENWIRWNEADWDSDEELVAGVEFYARLVTLLHETVTSG